MAVLCSEFLRCRVMFLFMLVLGMGPPFQCGFTVSVLSAPSLLMKSFINQTWLDRYSTPISDETLTFLWSFIVSIFSIGALLGGIISLPLIRKYGKMRCQQGTNLLMLGASLIIGCSKMAASFEMILIGRFLCGVCAGIGVIVSMQFLAEIAPKKMRGLSSSSVSIFLTSGKLVGQIIGLSDVLGSEFMWPLLVSISGITSLLQLVVFPLFPDTPANLLMQNKDKEGCMKAMKILWGAGDHQEEMEDLLKEQRARKKIKILSILELIREKSLRLQLCLQTTIVIALQLSGINAIYFYGFDVFRQVGIPPERTPYVAIGVGVADFVGCIACTVLIERLGRKVLLLSGFGVMALVLGLLTATLSMQDTYPWIPYCSMTLIFCYILFLGAGPSGVSCATIFDFFSQSARTSAMMLTNGLNWALIYAVGMLFPYMVNSLGHFCFLIFLCILLISSIFLFLFCPETKGKSITEITEECNRMQSGWVCCRGARKHSLPEYAAGTKL